MCIKIFLIHYHSRLIVRKIKYYNILSLKYQSKLNHNTFQLQILTYFENTIELYKESQQNAISAKIKKQHPVTKTKLEHIHKYIKNNSNLSNNYQNLNIINKLCFSIIDSLEPLEILSILNALLKYFSVTNITFYNEAVFILQQKLKSGLLSDHSIIQLIYFMSLQNKIYVNQVHKIRHYIPNIDSLPLIEKCILAMSLFRSNYKLDYIQKKEFYQTIDMHAKQLIYQPGLLTSLCKIIRVSGSHNDLDLENLSEAISTSSYQMNFTMIAHVLSLYAVSNIFNKKVIDRINKESIEFIKKDVNFNLRIKDLSRFLWASSHLNVMFTSDTKRLLKDYVQLRFTEFINKKNLGYFIDTLLSLHILQCWNYEVVKYCFRENIFESIINEDFHWKVKCRFQILINQINLEMKIRTPSILKKCIKIVNEYSENLNLVMKVIAESKNKQTMNKALIEYPINTLFIPGITFITDKIKYHIDVLDDKTCLRNSNTPNGMMNLKIRLVSKLNYQHILIGKDVFEGDPMKIQSKIYHEIKSIVNSKTEK